VTQVASAEVGGKSDVGHSIQKDLGAAIHSFEELREKANKAAQDLQTGSKLTSKEASALGRSLNLTAGEVRGLVKEEKLAVSEARTLAQEQMRLDKETRSLADAANDSADGIGAMAAGLQAAASAAVIHELVEAGTALFNIGLASDSAVRGLNALTGSHADEFINDVTRGTRLTVSEMKAAQISSQLFSMGLADTSEEATEMTRVAVILGGALKGMNASDAASEFAVMMANMSVERLDSFGISSGRVRTRINELMEATAGLTREEAFHIAVMEQAVPRADQLEGSISDAQLAVQQIAAAWEDLTAAGGEAVMEFFTPTIEGARNLVVGLNETRKATDDFKRSTALAANDAGEYARALADANLINDVHARHLERLIRENVDLSKSTDEVVVEYRELHQEMVVATALTEGQAMAEADLLHIQRQRVDPLEEIGQATHHLALANKVLNPAILDVVAALKSGTMTELEANRALWMLGATSEDVTVAQSQLAQSQRDAEQAARDHAQALRDQQREFESIAGLVVSTSEDIGKMGAQAWQESTASGQAYLEFLKNVGVDLSQIPGMWDQIRLQQGLATEETLGMEQTLRGLGSAIQAGLIDPLAGADLFEQIRTGQMTLDELQGKLDSLNTAHIMEMMDSIHPENFDILGQKATEANSTVQTTTDDATLSLQNQDSQLQLISDKFTAMPELVTTGMASIVETVPGVMEALAPLSDTLKRYTDFFLLAPEMAKSAWDQIAAAMQANWEVLGTTAGFINGMTENWKYLQANPNLHLNIEVETEGTVPGGGGAAGNAAGTPHWRGGMTWVGERGPELVDLPPGARVHSYSDSMNMQRLGELGGPASSTELRVMGPQNIILPGINSPDDMVYRLAEMAAA